MTSLTEVVRTYAQHYGTVAPGRPAAFTGAHTVGDEIWQGDLGLSILSLDAKNFTIPEGYQELTAPTDKDRQLVPESGQGSRHRVASLEGVRIFRPTDWGKQLDDLRGPILVFLAPGEIVHEPGRDNPHGTVTIEDPMVIRCRYQRNLSLSGLAQRARD